MWGPKQLSFDVRMSGICTVCVVIYVVKHFYFAANKPAADATTVAAVAVCERDAG